MISKETIKSKAIYLVSLLLMCVGLILVAYFFFLRTIELDVTKNIRLYYSGENGRASVEAKSGEEDLNQRIQEFYDTLTYTIEPNEALSNGDVLHIQSHYDEALAQQYHFQIANPDKEVIVEGLPNRIDSIQEMNRSFLLKVQESMDSYLGSHKKEVLSYDALNFESNGSIVEQKLVYFAFLKSNSIDNSDKFIGLFQIKANEDGEEKTIYYMVLVPDINESEQILARNIYGEKAYMSEAEQASADYGSYIERVYGSQYTIEEGSVHMELNSERMSQ